MQCLGRPGGGSQSRCRRRRGRSEIRILFVFDPWQQIVLLVAGDKAGDWRSWYSQSIPRAEQLYAEHIEAMDTGGAGD
jgi:hypothetical protein